jgi:hypothetical protein
MKTKMKLIVAATGAVILASPVLAGDWRTAPVPLSTSNVYWGLGYRGYAHQHSYGHGYGHGYGAAGYPHAGQPAPAVRPPTLDCVHVAFPQCDAGG